jgi:hypothetical protein
MHLETGQIRPRLKRWKWTAACGFGLSDDVPSPPADGLRVEGGTQDETMKLCAGRAGPDVVAVAVITGTRETLVPVGTSGFVLLGRSASDKLAWAVGLDRDGRERPRSALRF